MTIIYNVHEYFFARENVKSKYRGVLKLIAKTAEAMGYGECMVQTVVAEKSGLGAASSSPANGYREMKMALQ
jgi:hypothetical protein